jgi:hypothetical protein
MTRARLCTVIAATIVAGAVVTAAVPAGASPTGTGSATAAAAYGTTTTIAPSTPSGTGLLGSIVAGVLQPLVTTLSSTINTTVGSAVIGLLNANGNQANTSGGSTSYPHGASLGLAVPGVAELVLSGPSGSVSSSPAYAATSTLTGGTLALLGISAASLGVATATTTCPTSGSTAPSAAVALTGVSVFDRIQAKIANGSTALQVSLDGGTSWRGVSSLSSTLTPVAGTTLSVRANGNLLQVSQSIPLTTLLSALGLSDLLDGLSGAIDTSGTSLALSVTVGPGNAASLTDSAGATAWGLEVGADLAGTVSVKLLSLLGGVLGGATVTIPSGITGSTYGNVLDLELAYATCVAGSVVPTPKWIPPGLI